MKAARTLALFTTFALATLAGAASANQSIQLNGFVNGNAGQPNLAVLTLSDAFTAGSPITPGEFVSFQVVGPWWGGGLWTAPDWSLNATGNPFPGPGLVMDLVSPVNSIEFTLSGSTLQEYFQGNPVTNMTDVTVSLPSPAPEPSSWAMLLAGLGVLGWVARRGSRRAA